MIYLLSAIFCSTAIALILKLGEERNCSRYVILSMNYVMAASISLWLVLKKNLLSNFSGGSPGLLLNQIESGYAGSDGFLSAESSALWSLVIGIPTGILYFLGFYYYQRSVRESGVGMAGSYAKMGILVPTVLSMVFWREFPGGFQWAGMILAVFAMILLNVSFGRKNIFTSAKPALLLLFISCGVSEFTNKLFQRYAMLDMKDLFLLFVFLTALLVSVFKIRTKPGKAEIATGLAVGIPNFLASFFLIDALSVLPASVVFPVYSAGSIALICAGGRVFYREKLTRKELAAVSITVAALILINLQ